MVSELAIKEKLEYVLRATNDVVWEWDIRGTNFASTKILPAGTVIPRSLRDPNSTREFILRIAIGSKPR
jgi:hypothetical protein